MAPVIELPRSDAAKAAYSATSASVEAQSD
jgi:hypothetical protein